MRDFAGKYQLLLNLMAAACLRKVVTGLDYHYIASLLILTTVFKCLGTEETSWWTLGGEILSHPCLIYDSSWSAVKGRLCPILLFMMLLMFSGLERAGLQADQSYTRTPLLWGNPVVTDAVWGFWPEAPKITIIDFHICLLSTEMSPLTWNCFHGFKYSRLWTFHSL